MVLDCVGKESTTLFLLSLNLNCKLIGLVFLFFGELLIGIVVGRLKGGKNINIGFFLFSSLFSCNSENSKMMLLGQWNCGHH